MVTEGQVTISLEDFRKMENAIGNYEKLKVEMRKTVGMEVKGGNMIVDCRSLKRILCNDVELGLRIEELDYDAVDTIEFIHGERDEI